ncbi:MAG: hypothetical protein P3T54_08160 [Dehalogenimonas sp.]|uniref:Uncharacterized protein n=1 Tax=Candidatus Dehalogenimonas loeffleri TaxID=3127115 RepID=A0ABZ2J413_9CHLR|nr:hypothetical protein [Dehalogenimonas sp.]
MRFGIVEIVIILLISAIHLAVIYYLNRYAKVKNQDLQLAVHNPMFLSMLTGNMLLFVSGMLMGEGWVISSILFVLLLSYMAILAFKSPLNGSAFALVFGIALVGQRSIVYFGGHLDIEPWIIAVFYLGAAMYMLPAVTRLISTGVRTGWR